MCALAAPEGLRQLEAGLESSDLHVDVYAAARQPTQVGDCLLRCDLKALAKADYQAGLHPAYPASQSDRTHLWRPIGVLPYPRSGVVLTDADTYIGQCPGAVQDGQPCAATLSTRSLTIVAGSPTDPKNLILSGSLGTIAASGTTLGRGRHVG